MDKCNLEIPEIFKYTEVEVPKDCIHKISPSRIATFFEYPVVYYNEAVKGEPSSFQGNTSTVMGTICHHIYKCVTKKIPIDRETINNSLFLYNKLKPELELDIDDIMLNYPLIAEAVVNQYIIPANTKANNIKVEESVLVKIDDGIYLGGTYDRYEDGWVIDYKNVSKLPSDTIIPFSYRIQMLAYAYALRQLGETVHGIKLVYGVKPTKTIGARCIEVPKLIDYEDEKLINDTLQLITESVVICHNRPELIHLIFKSYSLKQN